MLDRLTGYTFTTPATPDESGRFVLTATDGLGRTFVIGTTTVAQTAAVDAIALFAADADWAPPQVVQAILREKARGVAATLLAGDPANAARILAKALVQEGSVAL